MLASASARVCGSVRVYGYILSARDYACSYRGCCACCTACACWACGCACGCAGYNQWGELGLGDKNDRGDEPDEMGDNLEFVDLGSSSEVQSIALGDWHT